MNKGGFSLSRLLGISKVKQDIARKTGIPTTKSGVERKVGKALIDLVTGGGKKKK